MSHDATTGIVDATQYSSLLNAVQTRTWAAFNGIQRAPGAARKYVNPIAGLTYELIGSDPQQLYVPPPPTFASNEQGSEFVELAWMALLRDVPFDQYGINSVSIQAINELNSIAGYQGTKPVTGANLFRPPVVGTVGGPFLSQFFYLPTSYGINELDLKVYNPLPGLDYMTNWTEFIRIQNCGSYSAPVLETSKRYMITGRDLAGWVHYDMLAEAYHIAAMTLLNMGAPFNPTNPYLTSANQEGFGTFGPPHIVTLMLEMSTRSLHNAWNNKWNVNRRLRPEEYGGCVDRAKRGIYAFPVSTVATTSVAATILNATYGSYLLPQAFSEGSPLHPSYLAGHSTVAGAAVTILKAFFQNDWNLTTTVQPNANGTQLLLYNATKLNVAGELNKLACNVGVGRNFGGVHFYSDMYQSLFVGEKIAIATLRNYKSTFAEAFSGWSFTGFDGTVVTI
jgi:hypothetical protein